MGQPRTAIIIPTGDELVSGIVVDTNGPAIRKVVLSAWPGCHVHVFPPVSDTEEDILQAMDAAVAQKAEVGVLIGGSGGGREYDPGLARDCTHHVLAAALEPVRCRSLYGRNGHLWSRLVAGWRGGCLFFGVPGPNLEAIAAAEAGVSRMLETPTPALGTLVDALAQAVLEQFPMAPAQESRVSHASTQPHIDVP